MDFSYQYTEEQQEFRREVSDRLKRIVPDDVSILDTPSTAGFETIQQIRKMLGANGWLAAADSQETRGAGLTADHNVVILEELNRLGLLFLLEDETATLRSAVLQWGDESQNIELVRPIAQGEVAAWKQKMSPSYRAVVIRTPVRWRALLPPSMQLMLQRQAT
ncbi:MAG: acyl-CoA/acyl-ACP dehydrogenase [Chloroflexi bacterium]|nr:acyl-CoA/acyl-ACP dehydrogenase [Chloroflexota bacterium]